MSRSTARRLTGSMRPRVHTKLWFDREGDEWTLAEHPEPALKGPARYGTFNSAFDNHALLVYGTAGNAEENAWALAKARFDAETFYYRGGGALEMIPDTRFDFNRDPDRNVILYGNADTNTAWQQLLATSPIEVRRGHVRVGTRTETGDALAVLAVRPRPGSNIATVGIVAGTGPAGMRLTESDSLVRRRDRLPGSHDPRTQNAFGRCRRRPRLRILRPGLANRNRRNRLAKSVTLIEFFEQSCQYAARHMCRSPTTLCRVSQAKALYSLSPKVCSPFHTPPSPLRCPATSSDMV